MSRDEARKAFKDAGLTYAVITPVTLQRLRTLINMSMKDAARLDGTFRCKQRGIITRSKSGRFFAGIRRRAFYFDDREAVSFNDDGFIGFVGWADDTNVQPILDGFCAWVDELKGKQERQHDH